MPKSTSMLLYPEEDGSSTLVLKSLLQTYKSTSLANRYYYITTAGYLIRYGKEFRYSLEPTSIL